MGQDTGSEPTADSREQGIDFGPLEAKLDEQEYPLTQGELLSALGDEELDLADGSVTLREILGEQQSTDGEERTYESADAVHQAVLNMVGDEAVGRTDYSDRGGQTPDDSEAGEDADPESL